MENVSGEEIPLLSRLYEGDPKDEGDMSPMDRSKYPENWKEISWEYKESIGWKCEWCGIQHLKDLDIGNCLTVHHPDHDPENPDARLIGLCARCHLREELRYRIYGWLGDQLQLFEGKEERDG